MAEQALESKKNADAVTYYQVALQSNASDPRIKKLARRLWDRLGGSEEGWNQFLLPVQNAQISLLQDKSMPLPEFELRDTNGRIWRKTDLKRKVTFINVWATWCGPCVWEMPAIEELYKKLQNHETLQLITLNIDENPGLVPPFLKKHNYQFPSLFALSISDKLDAQSGIPRNWIVNQEASVVKEIAPFGTQEKSKWIEQILSGMTELAQSIK
jgi:thiol-disulfide isomerase/thioredoxin